MKNAITLQEEIKMEYDLLNKIYLEQLKNEQKKYTSRGLKQYLNSIRLYFGDSCEQREY